MQKINANYILLKRMSGFRKNIAKKITSRTFIYSFLIIWTIVSIYPFIWTVGASLRVGPKALDGGVNPFVGSPLSLRNYELLFKDDSGFGASYVSVWIKNSVIYSTLNSTINLFFNFLTGYAISKLAFRGRNQVFWYFLILMFIPLQIIQVPSFLITAKMGLLPPNNNYIWFFGILIGSSTNTYLIFMIRQFFKSSKSQADDAARIDGLSVYGVYFRVVLRMVVPLIATQFAIVFMWSWNSFIIFTLYAGPKIERQTIVTGISWLTSAYDPNTPGKVMAAASLTSIPVFVIYGLSLLFQRGNTVKGDK